ncbi:MAG: hypothetical protein EB084_21030 [Proteobacteria bacterium]|nr:hypothetical protein [Pseudomonadota bacterium]
MNIGIRTGVASPCTVISATSASSSVSGKLAVASPYPVIPAISAPAESNSEGSVSRSIGDTFARAVRPGLCTAASNASSERRGADLRSADADMLCTRVSSADASAEGGSRASLLRSWGIAFTAALSLAGCGGGGSVTAPAVVVVEQTQPVLSARQGSDAVRTFDDAPAAVLADVPASAQKPVKLTEADYEKVYQAVPLLRPHQKGMHPAVRFEMLAPTSSPEDLHRLAERYRINVPLVDAMLDAETTPSQRADIARDLGILPTSLLENARAQGVRIWVANDGVKEVPARLFAADAPEPARGIAKNEPAVVGPPYTDAKPLPGARDLDAIRASDAFGPHVGDTLADVARRRGAQTPEQVKQFVDLAVKMNQTVLGKKLDAAKPLEQGQLIELPDLGWYQGQPIRAWHLGALKTNNESLSSPTVGGFYQHGTRLLVVRSTVLPDPATKFEQGERAIVHEFGHVAESLISDDPALGHAHFEQMKVQRDVSLARYEKGDDRAFITEYGTTNMAEHYAEVFESYFTAGRPDSAHRSSLADGNFGDLQVHGPGYADLMQREVRLWDQGNVYPAPRPAR